MKGATAAIVAFATVMALASLATAYDGSPLQDLCVAINDPKGELFVNGKLCKNPKLAVANDFFFKGLNTPRSTKNRLGSNVTFTTVDQVPGLNTLGLSISRIDFAPYGGLNPPHHHPRASEILLVLEGTLFAGFVTSNQDGNRLFFKVLNPGDIFVSPIGMIHFQLNIGGTPAVAFAHFNSQNPGTITIANAVFGSKPLINPDVFTKSFQLNENIVKNLQKLFGGSNS